MVVNKPKHSGSVLRRKRVKERRRPKVITENVRTKLRKRGCRGKKKRSASGNNKQLVKVQEKNEELINRIQVTEAVHALLLLIEKTADANSHLFGDEPQPILMQVGAVRVPKVPSRRLRFKLPHPVITDTTDVCIIVHNLTKKFRKNFERTVEHYKERFAKEGISQISRIIPMKQLKVEYTQYEEKRRLCQQFDVFLSDVRISDRVALHFGKFLKYSMKTPIPVRVDVENLKEEIDKALSKTTMQLHGKGDSFIVQVGHTKQPVEAVVQNICSVATGLSREFPGGWDNVSTVYIKTTNSLSIPVYVSLKSPNDVPVPIVKPRRPKLMVPIEGELSTRVGYIAKVFPAGRVDLKKDTKKDSDVEWSDDDWETEWRNFENKVFSKAAAKKESQSDDEKPAKNVGKKPIKEESDVEVKDESQVEDDVAEAEESYLQQWKRKRDDDYEEKKKKIKGEVSVDVEPKRKKVKYEVGEMCLGRLGGETARKPGNTSSGGMARTAFQELKSKISRKKLAKKHKMAAQNNSVICSNKVSGRQKNKNVRGKSKNKSSK